MTRAVMSSFWREHFWYSRFAYPPNKPPTENSPPTPTRTGSIQKTRALLKVIQDTKPQSISTLAEMTGRKPGNLSRTLKTMSNYGFVEMKRENRQVRPIAKATEFRIVA